VIPIVPSNSEVSEDPVSIQTEISDAEQLVSADQRTEAESGDSTGQASVSQDTIEEEFTPDNIDSLSLGESPPTNDTTPLILLIDSPVQSLVL
jgi:hypothetical protein